MSVKPGEDLVAAIFIVITAVIMGCILGLAFVGGQHVIETHFTCPVCECDEFTIPSMPMYIPKEGIHSTTLIARRAAH